MPFLRLFHGRASPDEQLDGWGIEGPIFGPYSFFHTTYGVEIKFDEDNEHVLNIVDGLIFYGGMYYGDWSVFDGPPCESEKEFVVDFAPDLAATPASSTAVDSNVTP